MSEERINTLAAKLAALSQAAASVQEGMGLDSAAGWAAGLKTLREVNADLPAAAQALLDREGYQAREIERLRALLRAAETTTLKDWNALTNDQRKELCSHGDFNCNSRQDCGPDIALSVYHHIRDHLAELTATKVQT